jgi:hypothetical protein
VVFLSNDLPEVLGTSLENNEKREELASSLAGLSKELNLDPDAEGRRLARAVRELANQFRRERDPAVRKDLAKKLQELAGQPGRDKELAKDLGELANQFGRESDPDKRRELANELDRLAEEVLRRVDPRPVVLCLAGPSDLEKYGLNPNAALTVVLYRDYKVVSSHELTRDQVTDARVKEILQEVRDKLLRKR